MEGMWWDVVIVCLWWLEELSLRRIEKGRNTEWFRMIMGVLFMFMNKSKWIWMIAFHFMFINWWMCFNKLFSLNPFPLLWMMIVILHCCWEYCFLFSMRRRFYCWVCEKWCVWLSFSFNDDDDWKKWMKGVMEMRCVWGITIIKSSVHSKNSGGDLFKWRTGVGVWL